VLGPEIPRGVRTEAFPTRSTISSDRPNDYTRMCRLGRSEARCRSVAVGVTPGRERPLTRRCWARGGAAEGRMLEQPGLARAGRTENMARLDDVAKRMRCLKCGEKKCTLRAFPPQKPRGYRSLPK
jgi:hypothetical protein